MKTLTAVALLFCIAGAYALPRALLDDGEDKEEKNQEKKQESSGLPDYQQCGGLGGICRQNGDDSCVDGPWEGVKCSEGSECVRNTADHWMCKPAAGGSSSSSSGEESSTKEKKSTKSDKEQTEENQKEAKRKESDDDKTAATQNLEDLLGKTLVTTKDGKLVNGNGGGRGSGSSGSGGSGTADVDGDGIIPKWKQCGGSTGACSAFGDCKDCRFPGTKCEDGYVCSRVVEFFWQCAPADLAVEGPTCESDDAEFKGLKTKKGGKKGGSSDAAKCGERAEDMEVDGTFLDSVALATETPFHECCDACVDASDCVAFQVNGAAGNATCDLFSSFTELVSATGSVAASLPEPAAVAGK